MTATCSPAVHGAVPAAIHVLLFFVGEEFSVSFLSSAAMAKIVVRVWSTKGAANNKQLRSRSNCP